MKPGSDLLFSIFPYKRYPILKRDHARTCLRRELYWFRVYICSHFLIIIWKRILSRHDLYNWSYRCIGERYWRVFPRNLHKKKCFALFLRRWRLRRSNIPTWQWQRGVNWRKDRFVVSSKKIKIKSERDQSFVAARPWLGFYFPFWDGYRWSTFAQ